MRLWRSLMFWGGLVVMGAIGWAWRDSTRYMSFLSCKDYVVYNVGGGLCVARTMGTGIQYERHPVRSGEEDLQGKLHDRHPVNDDQALR